MKIKEAIVLAGGFGTRLQSVVQDVPKPMAEVCGRPFLSFLLDDLAASGFTHVILSTGYRHECIEHFYGNSYGGMRISYARELEPLGTGGGIWNALQFSTSDYTFVLNGDTRFLADLEVLENLSLEKKAPVIALRRVEDTSRYGRVETAVDGRIVRFVEKAAANGSGYINGGIYLLPKSLFSAYKVGERFSFEKDILEKVYQNVPIYAKVSEAYFIDIGIPEDYFRAQNEFLIRK